MSVNLRINGFLVFTAAEGVAGGDMGGQPNVSRVLFRLASGVVERNDSDAEFLCQGLWKTDVHSFGFAADNHLSAQVIHGRMAWL